MQWETATPVGFPVCVRHKDSGLKKTAVRRLKAEMNQRVVLHTPSAPEREIARVPYLYRCLSNSTIH